MTPAGLAPVATVTAMSTSDGVFVVLEVVMAVLCLALAGWLLIQARRGPGPVRVFRRVQAQPRLQAAAYLCFGAGFTLDAVDDLFDVGRGIGLIRLAVMLTGFVLLIAASRRKVSSSG